MTPRRSSRARTTQPLPNPPAHTNSSTSSNSASRADRATRSNNKPPSPQIQSAQRSNSIEEPDSTARPEPPVTRRSRRGNDNEKDESPKPSAQEEDVEDLEKDVTRCVCGHSVYPGPPQAARDAAALSASKPSLKEEHGAVTEQPVSDPLFDDIGDFFIQCDNCQVWQHGGCVGLTDESMSPDFYFCEECKPEYHKLHSAPDGSKYSRYLPVLEPSSTRSSSSSSTRGNGKRKDGKGRASDASLSTKRRATMNSRDAAYDEEEMLRKAIEESKEETGTLGKRQRAESEENRDGSKRQRTSSSSPSSLSKQSRSPSQVPSEEDGPTRPNANGNNNVKKIRGAAARNHRDKEMRERQKEIAAQRAEAASKRNARSERRRVEESPPLAPTLSPPKATSQPAPISQKLTAPDTPSSQRNNSTTHRKTGRPPARRGRLGRNQYTRDMPAHGGNHDSPTRDHSRDPTGRSGTPAQPANGFSNGITGESGRNSKPKYHPVRTTMNEMKRRVAAILEFVTRMQAERQSQLSSGSGSEAGSKASGTPNGVPGGNPSGVSLQAAALMQAVEAGLSVGANGNNTKGPKKSFSDMASAEMMDVLTRDLVGWQSLYGKFGEK